MKIGMQTWGSHGDIRPFLALAAGLGAAGHAVHLVITCVDSDAYTNMPAPPGVRITALALPLISAEQIADMGRTAYTIRNPMTQMAAILRLAFAPFEDAMYAAARMLGAESELLVGHYFMHPLQIAAEQARLPYVSVLLSHAAVPSAFNHPLGLRIGQLGNRMLWRLTRALLSSTVNHYPNRLRAQAGLPLTRDIVNEVWISAPLTLLAVSPQLCDPQPDWPASIHTCGFLDMPNIAVEGALPPALAGFLAAGAAPVYMTLGSWMPGDVHAQSAMLRLFTQAAKLAGCRAIIQSPSWQACGVQSGDGVLYVSAAPHHAIFPLCRAVVHHGGAGTTQSATLAGKPSVIIAHISEQEHWGRELRRVGIAGKPLKRRSVTAASLARRLRAVLENEAMARKAMVVAAAMRKEDGVATAVAAIGLTFAPVCSVADS